jgi:iron complex outermembrane recepter protein
MGQYRRADIDGAADARIRRTTQGLRRVTLAHAMRSAFAVAGLAAAFALPASAQAAGAAAAAQRAYDIPAGPLEAALNRFGREAGILLSFPTDTTAGLQSPGLRGRYGVAQALSALLQGTGLEAVAQPGGGYTLVKGAPPAAAAATPAARRETTLAAVNVRALPEQESATGPVSGYTAKRSLSAMKTDTPLLETPRAVSVITEEQIRDRKVRTVEEAVAYTAGVQVSAWGNDPRFDQITVRGFELTVDADFRDGLRQPNAGWLSLFRTEPYALERLDVVKGPNSVMFGQISPGGLVNRISKRPTRESIREVEIQSGSDDHLQGQFDIGGALTEAGDWQYRVVGLARNSDTGTVGVNDDSVYFAPALTWAPSDGTRVTVLSHWQDYETAGSPRPFQLPSGELTGFWAGDVDFDGLKQTQYAIGYEAEHRFSDTLSIRQNLRYGNVDTDNQYTDGTLQGDGVTIARTTWGVYESMDTLAIDTALEGRFSTGPLQHLLVGGVDYAWLDGSVRYLFGNAPSISMLDPDRHQNIARPTGVAAHQDIEGEQTGVYVNDQISWADWRISMGVRRDHADQTQKDVPTAVRTSQKDSATTGSIGVLYVINNSISPYASYSTSFVPKFGSDVNGDAYKPTEGKQIEAGVKVQPAGTRNIFTLSVFNLEQRNMLTQDPANVANQIQTGEVRSRGVELEANATLTDRLSVVASYTWLDMEITRNNDGNEGKRPVGIPEHMASVWAKYAFSSGALSGVDVGVGTRWIGKTYSDSANTTSNDSYGIVDARISYDLRHIVHGASIALNATNLSDNEYLMCHDGYCYRGRGRTVVGSLNYRW